MRRIDRRDVRQIWKVCLLLVAGILARTALAGTIENFSPSSYSTVPGSPFSGVIGPMFEGLDQKLYALDYINSAISAVDPATNTATPHSVKPEFFNITTIAETPDGKLWFGEFQSGKVGFVDPANGDILKAFFVELMTSSAFGNVEAIGAGPDGNLWFGEVTDSFSPNTPAQIVKITSAGTVQRFITSFTHVDVHGIVAGPDGNVWVTIGGKVLRITTSGSMATFSPPTSVARLGNIIVGPDNNLWTTEPDANNVVRLTTAGTFTEIPVPTGASAPNFVVAGPDGNVWFSETAGAKMARLNLSIVTAVESPQAGVSGDLIDESPPFIDSTFGPEDAIFPVWLPRNFFCDLVCPSDVVQYTPFARDRGSSPGTTTCFDLGLSIVDVCVPAVLTPATLPKGRTFARYEQTISIIGLKPPFHSQITGLPPGMTMIETGDNNDSLTITGVPQFPGGYLLTIRTVDDAGCETTTEIELEVDVVASDECPPIVISRGSPPTGFTGRNYPPDPNGPSASFTVSGGFGPSFVADLFEGDFPPGLELRSAAISYSEPEKAYWFDGSPTKAGTYEFTLRFTDEYGCVGLKSFTIEIVDCPQIDAGPDVETLPDADAGRFYAFPVEASGGDPPYGYSVSGNFPDGLSIDPSTGIVSGSPTDPGSYTFTVKITDRNGCFTLKTFDLTVNPPCPPISVETDPLLLDASIGVPFNVTFTASGGKPPYTYATTVIAPPGGKDDLSAAGGGQMVTGIPRRGGTYVVLLTVTDSEGCRDFGFFPITVHGCPAITLTPTSIAGAVLNGVVNQTIAAQGGTPGYNYAVTAGSLPPFVGLNPATGLIFGVPTVPGTFSFTVTATDSVGCIGSRSYLLTVGACGQISLKPAPLSNGLVNAAYSGTLVPSGGESPYSFALEVAGSLPAGLSIDGKTGKIDGTPTAAGTYGFLVKVTDKSGCVAFFSETIVVDSAAAPDLAVAKVADVLTALRGDTVTYTITIANIGSGPTAGTWSVSDLLPSGFSISTTNVSAGSGLACQQGTSAGLPAVGCSSTTAFPPGSSAVLTIVATVSANASPGEAVNVVSVSGGGQSRIDDDESTATVLVELSRSQGGVSGIAPAHPAKISKPGAR